MHMSVFGLAPVAACFVLTIGASAQSAREIRGVSPLVAIENEPPARLIVDVSGETVILLGLPPGPHSVLFELADPTHRVITRETVRFTVPALKADSSSNN